MADFLLPELIAPIEGGVAVGGSVRTSGAGSELYLSVKDDRAAARVAEREALSSGDPEAEPLVAGLRSWTMVAGGGAELLARYSKDLQIAAWVVEAWLRTDGLAGLADGFTLLAELVEHYWDEGLHPIDDEDADDVDGRLAPLFGLFGREEPGTLIQPIKLLRLTDAVAEPVALWNIETIRAQSIRHDDPEIREELAAKRTQRIAEMENAIAAASHDFISNSLSAIERALGDLDRLMVAVDHHTSQGRFGSQVTAPLEAIAEILRQNHVPVSAPQSIATSAEAVFGEPDLATSGTPAKQNVPDRTAALATLLEIASFFEQSEPQSFVGHGLRELVRRAKLPLDELVAELLPDRDQRAMFMLRAGVRSEPPGGADNGITTF